MKKERKCNALMTLVSYRVGNSELKASPGYTDRTKLTGADPEAKAREDSAGPPAFGPPAARPPARWLAHNSARGTSSAPPSSSSSSRSSSSSGSITTEPTRSGGCGRRPRRLKLAAPETRQCGAHAQERPPRLGAPALSTPGSTAQDRRRFPAFPPAG